MIKDTDELQLDLPLDIGSEPSNVRTFAPRKKATATAGAASEPEATTEELMEKGLEIFAQELSEDAKGFFALIFDSQNTPRIVWAGDIDMITAIGSLEMAKNELYNNIFTNIE